MTFHLRLKKIICVFLDSTLFFSRDSIFLFFFFWFLLAFQKNSITPNLPYLWPFCNGFATFAVIFLVSTQVTGPNRPLFRIILQANKASIVLLIEIRENNTILEKIII